VQSVEALPAIRRRRMRDHPVNVLRLRQKDARGHWMDKVVREDAVERATIVLCVKPLQLHGLE
jgi:hypothetical protein